MSIADVAKRAGVSQATVSYVINNKKNISPQTIEKVTRAIEELGYTPRASRTRGKVKIDSCKLLSGNIALAIPKDSMSMSQLNTKLFEEIHKELEKRNLRLVPIRIAKGSDLGEIISSNKAFSNLDGLIMFYRHATPPKTLPCVSILGRLNLTEDVTCNHIEPNNIRIGAVAAHYLASKGHKNIAVIKPSTKRHPAMDLRIEGFVSVAQKLGINGLAYNIPIELRCSETGALLGVDKNHPLTKLIENFKSSNSRPTGIFIPSDSHLLIAYNAFRKAGIEPEEDVDFIGCNNETMILQSMSPMPASIDIRPDVMARTAIDMLVQRICTDIDLGYSTTLIEPKLVKI